jgi:hypothetical protein
MARVQNEHDLTQKPMFAKKQGVTVISSCFAPNKIKGKYPIQTVYMKNLDFEIPISMSNQLCSYLNQNW